MFPAFLILYDSRDERLLGRRGQMAFWSAAILTTGLSPLTLGRSGFNIARELSVYTIAALIIYGGLIAVCASHAKRALEGISQQRERAAASEPRDRSAPAKRRARARVGESEGRSPSAND